MLMFFSPSFAVTDGAGNTRTGGFFDSNVHGDSIPDDAVEISEKRYRELFDAQADGKEIYIGPNGKPRYRERRISADEQREAFAQAVRAEAARRIEQVSPVWRQINDQRLPTPAGDRRFAQIDAIREASNTIIALTVELPATSLPDFPVADHPVWPQIEDPA